MCQRLLFLAGFAIVMIGCLCCRCPRWPRNRSRDPRRRPLSSPRCAAPSCSAESASLRKSFAISATATWDGRHVGNCGLVKIDRQRAKAEMWIYLGHNHGTGLGSAALKELLDRAFDGLGLRRVSLRVVDGNDRAIAFYRRAGFKIEGRARSDTVRDGKSIDSTLMSVLRHEHRATPTGTM